MKKDISKNTGVVILSGGNSQRMNFPKCFLSFHNQTLIEFIAKTYLKAGIEKPVIVLNNKFLKAEFSEVVDKLKKYAIIVKNNKPEKGRMYSIKLGLSELKNKDLCFIHNVDNPTINEELINKMLQKAKVDSYVSPFYNGKNGHPVLLGKNVLLSIFNNSDDNKTLKEILSSFEKIDVDSGSLNVLENINSSQDWKNFNAKIKENAKYS